MGLLISWLALSATFLVTSKFLPDVKLKSLPWALKAAALFGVANLLLGWLLGFVLGLLSFFTLGLTFVLGPIITNMVLLKITDEVIEEEFEIESLGAFVKFSAILAVVDVLTGML